MTYASKVFKMAAIDRYWPILAGFGTIQSLLAQKGISTYGEAGDSTCYHVFVCSSRTFFRGDESRLIAALLPNHHTWLIASITRGKYSFKWTRIYVMPIVTACSTTAQPRILSRSAAAVSGFSCSIIVLKNFTKRQKAKPTKAQRQAKATERFVIFAILLRAFTCNKKKQG